MAFDDLDLDATGTVDRQEGVVRFTEIVLRARLTVPSGTDLVRARDVLDKAKRACLISASLSTPIRLDATIVETPLARPDRAVA